MLSGTKHTIFALNENGVVQLKNNPAKDIKVLK